jgi:hypothetical protein
LWLLLCGQLLAKIVAILTLILRLKSQLIAADPRSQRKDHSLPLSGAQQAAWRKAQLTMQQNRVKLIS